MTGLKLYSPFVFAIALFAQSSPDTLGSWGQLSALGVVAIVLVFIVTRMLPQIHQQFVTQSESFAKAMLEAQKEFTESVDKIATRQHEDSVNWSKALLELKESCSAVKALGLFKGGKNE